MQLSFKAGCLAALALSSLSPSLAAAHEFKAGDLLIRHPWSRATPGGAQVAGGYLTIVNQGTAADRLVGGSFEASSGFELHRMSMDDSIMRMRPTGDLEIPAGGELALEPSSTHIMFTGLKHGIKKGETVDGTLVFEHAGTVPVRFDVQAIGAKGPAGGENSGHAGPTMPGLDMN